MTIDNVIQDVQNPQFDIKVKRRKRSHNYSNVREYNKKTRIYIWLEDESIMDNFINRHSRPYTMYRKQILPKVFKELGWPLDTKVKWSQYAGCTCPCSPGFIINQLRQDPEYGSFYDICVTISAKENLTN